MEPDVKELCEAAARGDVQALENILKQNPGLIGGKHDGATALHFAALEGRNEAVEFLIARGADINIEDDEFGSAPAGWANERGHEGTVALIVKRGADMTPNRAAAWGVPDRVRQLLDRNPELVDERDAFGTPLHEAVIWGRIEIVEELLARGADPGLRASNGKTALELAQEQAGNGRSQTTIVSESRRREIQANCARIVELLSARLV